MERDYLIKCIFCLSDIHKIKTESEIQNDSSNKILTNSILLLDLSKNCSEKLQKVLKKEKNKKIKNINEFESLYCLRCQQLILGAENILEEIKILNLKYEEIKLQFKNYIEQSVNCDFDDSSNSNIEIDRKWNFDGEKARKIILSDLGYLINQIKVESENDDSDSDRTNYDFSINDNDDDDYDNGHNDNNDLDLKDFKEEIPEIPKIARKRRSSLRQKNKTKVFKIKKSHSDSDYSDNESINESNSDSDYEDPEPKKNLQISKKTNVKNEKFTYPQNIDWKKCQICDLKFKDKKLYFGHYYSKHGGPKYFNCSKCEELFGSYPALCRHREKAHQEKRACPECKKEFTKSVLADHIKHSCTFTFRPRLKCSFEGCEKTFKFLQSLKRHEVTHQNLESSFLCQECGKGFPTEYKLKSHLKYVHSEEILEKKSRKEFKCKYCDYSTHAKTVINDHHLTHLDEYNFVCFLCGYKSKTKYPFQKHMKRYHTEKAFKCDECEKIFADSYLLKRHKMTHLPPDKRPLKCQFCDRTFNSKEKMESHQSQHLGIRNFACDLCPKTFTHSKNLNHHKYGVHLNKGKKPRKKKINI